MIIPDNIRCLLASTALILVLLSGSLPAQETHAASSAAITDIKISFKLDTRLTHGQYMGDLWVSPPTYTGTVGQDTVDARVEGVDVAGNSVVISSEWTASDPSMIEVSPEQGKEVKITVKRTGESRLTAVAPGFSKELYIKAVHKNNAMQIDITPVQTSIVGKQKETEGTEGQREKVSYSLGYITGSRIKRESMDIDPDVYVKSFKEGFAGDKPAMTDQEMRDTLATIQKDWKTKQSEQKKEAAAERNKLAEKNKKEGEAFLSENAMKEGVVTLPGGLQYKIIKEGTGKQPASTDKVKVHYRGSLINGTEFDSSYKRGAPAEFNLDKVIKGWTDALPLMKEGSKWMLYIPPDLGYGKRGGGARGKIGPNQTLIFEVELLSVEQRGQ